MFIDFNIEVNTKEELDKYLVEKKIELPSYRPAVIALILDKEGNILLQRRGPKSRDEFGMLEDIGGAVEESDVTFRDAMGREIIEEASNEMNFTINKLIGGCLINKFNPRVGEDVNWLFLLYECSYIDGEIRCNEEGKALGYEWYKYDEFPKEEIASSTLSFWEYYYNKKETC